MSRLVIKMHINQIIQFKHKIKTQILNYNRYESYNTAFSFQLKRVVKTESLINVDCQFSL